MNQRTKNAIINRLDRAKAGSIDLNADIYEALGHRVKRARTTPEGITYRWFNPESSRWQVMLDLTGDFEAALTLLPNDWTFKLTIRQGNGHEIFRDSDRCFGVLVGRDDCLAVWVCLAILMWCDL